MDTIQDKHVKNPRLLTLFFLLSITIRTSAIPDTVNSCAHSFLKDTPIIQTPAKSQEKMN